MYFKPYGIRATRQYARTQSVRFQGCVSLRPRSQQRRRDGYHLSSVVLVLVLVLACKSRIRWMRPPAVEPVRVKLSRLKISPDRKKKKSWPLLAYSRGVRVPRGRGRSRGGRTGMGIDSSSKFPPVGRDGISSRSLALVVVRVTGPADGVHAVAVAVPPPATRHPFPFPFPPIPNSHPG